MRAASVFSGIGAMDYAAWCAFDGTLDIRHMVEIDSFARRVLRKHKPVYWPNVTIHKDVRYVSADQWGVQLIYAGFPCQDISKARAGAGLFGARSGLWFELARIISDARPEYVVLENVSAIYVRGGATVVAQLAALGYDNWWLPVRAAQFGSPQYRERWILLGVTNSQRHTRTHSQQISSQTIRVDSPSEPVQISNEAEPACVCRRADHRSDTRYPVCKPAMGRDVTGIAAGLVQHQWPAGSWQPQLPHEPPRLAKKTATWADEIRALGNIATPQQLYPVFRAIYDEQRQILDEIRG